MVSRGNDKVTGKQAFPYTLPGLKAILERAEVAIRFNTRAYHAEYLEAGSDELHGWRAWDDHYEGEIREWAADSFCGIKADDRPTPSWSPTEQWWRIMWSALMAQSRVDPFLEWLRNLPAWDRSYRVESLLADLLGAESSDLSRWASRYPFIGAIERAMSPGAKIDEFPVLIGPQGGGKSAWLASLLPVKAWFGDHLYLDGTSREQSEALDGKVIVEVSEMAGSRRAEVERIKAFLTRTDDGQHRRAYARHTAPSPRRCVFVGTANDSGSGVLPRDPTGSRRFVSIPVGEATRAVEIAVGELREALWAEAYVRFGVGDPGWASARLPRSLIAARKAANEPYESRDQTLDERVDKLPRKTMRMVDIAAHIGILGESRILPRAEQFRLADALYVAGWSKSMKRVDGTPTRVWEPPGGELRVVERSELPVAVSPPQGELGEPF